MSAPDLCAVCGAYWECDQHGVTISTWNIPGELEEVQAGDNGDFWSVIPGQARPTLEGPTIMTPMARMDLNA